MRYIIWESILTLNGWNFACKDRKIEMIILLILAIFTVLGLVFAGPIGAIIGLIIGFFIIAKLNSR